MPAGGKDDQPRVRDERPHHHRGLDARGVLIPHHDEGRHAQGAERRLQLRHRPPLGHHLAREVRARPGIVLARLAHELGEAARVLGLEGRPRGQALEAPEPARHALALEAVRGGRLALQELLAVHAARPGAHHDEAPHQLGVRDGEVARHVGSHGAAPQVHRAQAEVAQQSEEILDEDVLGVRDRIHRNARRRVAAVIVGDDAIPAREVAHLGLPGAMIAAELVAPDQRNARARLLVVQLDAAQPGDGHRRAQSRAPTTSRRCSALMISSTRRARPEAKEGRLLQRHELAVGARLRLVFRLPGPRGADVAVDQPVLVIDRRELGVVVEVLEILRVEDGDGDRLPGLPVLVVQELRHEIGIAVGRLGQARPRARAEAPAVAREDAQLHPPRLGHARQHRHVAPAIRRPLLRDHQDLGGASGLTREPADGRRLRVGEPVRLVPGAHRRGLVAPGTRRRSLPREIVRRADERQVLLERPAGREPLRRHHAIRLPSSPLLSGSARRRRMLRSRCEAAPDGRRRPRRRLVPVSGILATSRPRR